MTAIFMKDPDAVLDYSFVWTAWLADAETIATAEVTVETGLTEDSEADDGSVVTVWLSGGTAGKNYAVTCHIVTSDGREDDRTMTIRVRER